MTRRSEDLIDHLLRAREQEPEAFLDRTAVARDLRLRNLGPTEAGWVLRHLFGIPMAEAVHLATVSEPGVAYLDPPSASVDSGTGSTPTS